MFFFLKHSLLISKQEFTPVFEFTIQPINAQFGCAISALTICGLSFHIFMAIHVNLGIERFFPAAGNRWLRNILLCYIAIHVLNYLKGHGLLCFILLITSATIDLILVPPRSY